MRHWPNIACVLTLILSLAFTSTGAAGVFSLANLLFDHGHEHAAHIEHDGSVTLRHATGVQVVHGIDQTHPDHRVAGGEFAPGTVATSITLTDNLALPVALAIVVVQTVMNPVVYAQAIDPPRGPPLYLSKQTLLI